MATSGRLSKTVLPQSYTLNLNVIPEEGTFSGEVTMDIQIQQPTQSITLHALELTVKQAELYQHAKTLSATLSEDVTSETITLTCPEQLSAGPAQIRILYSGKLNKQLRGLYEVRHGDKTYAFTQFEATDARRMLPCFDEPAMKARFSLTVTYPAALTAISNMPAAEESVEGAYKKTRFDTTPVMSTYLLALALAPLQPKTIKIGETTVSVWALPDTLQMSAFALKVTSEVLPRLNDYFGLPYPYPKLDLISVPNFAMGAMENWGAIFFRDSCLLLDETLSSTSTQRDVANVITHEIVHQWFGNLVTMEWWDDLWLNESFATWMACKMVDQWRPEWNSWVEFQQEKEIPLSIDALIHTRPIQSEVTSAAQIEEMFDALTYEKGAACLRMIEQFLGEGPFREGIRRYMKRFQYKNTHASDLWEELTAASGQPVGAIARDWFTQPGFPLVTLRDAGRNGRSFMIEQKRFFVSAQQNDSRCWTIPFTFKYQDTRGIQTGRILLKDPVTPLTLPEPVRFLYGNALESGYLRVDYDPFLRDIVEDLLPTPFDPSERIGHLGNLWAFALSGRVPIDSFLNTLGRFRGDTTRVVVEAIEQYMETLGSQMVIPDDLPLFQRQIADLFAPLWKTLTWDPTPNEGEETALTRSAVLWGLGALAQDEDILAELPRRLTRYWAVPTSIDPTLATPLIRLCARFDGGALFDPYLKKYQSAATPEERDRYLMALADFNKPTLATKLLEMALSDTVRSQDVWKPVRYLLRQPKVQEVSWEFVKTHWAKLREKGGSVAATRMIQSTRSLWRPEWKTDVTQFFNRPENRVEAAERALLQTVEFIEIGIRFKEQQGPLVSKWLRAK